MRQWSVSSKVCHLPNSTVLICFLALILFYSSYLKCYHWRKLHDGHGNFVLFLYNLIVLNDFKTKIFSEKHLLCSNFFPAGFCWLSFYFRIEAKWMSLRLKVTVSLSSCNLYTICLHSKWIPWVGHALPLIRVFCPVLPLTWSALLPALFYEIFTKLSNRSHMLTAEVTEREGN